MSVGRDYVLNTGSRVYTGGTGVEWINTVAACGCQRQEPEGEGTVEALVVGRAVVASCFGKWNPGYLGRSVG